MEKKFFDAMWPSLENVPKIWCEEMSAARLVKKEEKGTIRNDIWRCVWIF